MKQMKEERLEVRKDVVGLSTGNKNNKGDITKLQLYVKYNGYEANKHRLYKVKLKSYFRLLSCLNKQLKPEVYIHCKKAIFSPSLSDIKSDQVFPVLGHLDLPEFIIFDEYQTNKRGIVMIFVFVELTSNE